MNKSEITFSANEQSLIKTGGIDNYASNTVSYIEATFTLGENWTGFDSVRAVWESYCAKVATVLDSNYKCIVPPEVLKVKSKVNVNLVGSIVEGNELTDRLTTYPILALTVDANARVEGDETGAVTPSQFEQFVAQVHEDAESIQDYTYDSEAWAKGTRGGIAVSSDDPTYHNNSKYYADQGATLQQEVTDLKADLNGRQASTEEITFTTGGYINNGNVSIVSLTPIADATARYAVVNCTAGDEFDVSCKSYSSARAWCFIDSNNNKLLASSTGTIAETVMAPSGSAKAVFNDDANSSGGATKLIPANQGLIADVSNLKTSTQLTDTISKNTNNQTVENYDAVFNHGVLNLGNVAYKRGGVDLLTGAYNDNASVLSHQMVDDQFTPIKLESDSIMLHVKSGYEARGVLLNPDKTYNTYFNWSTGGKVTELNNKKGYYAIICVDRTDSAELSDSEVSSAGVDMMWLEADFGLQDGVVGEIKKLQSSNEPFYGKSIVNFGDSIFGNFRDTDTTTDKSISTMIAEALGATVYNAGFGGCRMGYHSDGWRAFSMYALADAITTGVWTDQDVAIANPPAGLPNYFSDTLTMLKAIDFSEIDYITIGYGVNDYTGNAFIDYQTGLEEYQYFRGALEYSLRTILETYPNIRIAVITPCWMWFSDADTGLLDYSSDDAESENTRGYKLTDYVNACETVCEAYHVPCINTYNNLGFNPYSYKAYFNVKGIDGVVVSDGTHPKQAGRQLRADRISGEMIKLFCQ